MKTYTNDELIEDLMSGKKMRYDRANEGSYCYYNREAKGNPFFHTYAESGTEEAMNNVWQETQWEEYIEPKPKTTVYEWLYIADEYWFIEGCLYSEADAVIQFKGTEYRKTGRSWEV
jgi:hypothetical protein